MENVPCFADNTGSYVAQETDFCLRVLAVLSSPGHTHTLLYAVQTPTCQYLSLARCFRFQPAGVSTRVGDPGLQVVYVQYTTGSAAKPNFPRFHRGPSFDREAQLRHSPQGSEQGFQGTVLCTRVGRVPRVLGESDRACQMRQDGASFCESHPSIHRPTQYDV